jgi:hypothetical protein
MMTDDGLAELFERATADLDPGVPAIVGRAERLGRRMRTRLRMWMALGSCLALAALGAAGLGAGVLLAHPQGARITAGMTRGRASPTPSGRGGQASPAVSASPTPSASAGSTPGIAGGSSGQLAPGYQMTTGQMLGVLRKLLPAGSTVSNVNPHSSGDGSLEVDYNDGQGAVDLQIEVAPTATFAPLNCPKPLWADEGPRPAGALPISCAMRTLPDGSVERDAVYYADAYGFYGFSVYDQRPDGVTVDIQVGNGILHTLPQVDRARPPGSMAEWEAVAENPAWR